MNRYPPKQETLKGIDCFRSRYTDTILQPLNTECGCGAYSSAFLVNNGERKNKVIKAITYCESNAKDLGFLAKEYINYLTKAGLNIPTTQVVVEGSLFYLVQDLVRLNSAIELICEQEDKPALEIFNRVLSKTFRTFQNLDLIEDKNITGLDSRIENWCISEDLIFIDLFPPLLNDGSEIFKRFFYTTDFEREFTDNLKNLFLEKKLSHY